MILYRKPSAAEIRKFISSQQGLPFSYAEVGATKTGPPSGYLIDHNRIQLGEGEKTFRRAVEALRSWRQFDLGWVGIASETNPIDAGTTVAVQAQVLGLWTLNAAKIVYVIDELKEASARFGFAYGTLPDHTERGEERFLVELLEDGSVWYDIFAFSRPQHPLARLGFPITRRLQKRFARESLAAMKRAVGD
jgi:uncharacterized protein (UPF0548 family)